MANNYYTSLLGAMDRLWFHQIILFSQPPISLIKIASQCLETPQPVFTDSFKSTSSLDDDKKDEDLSTDFSPATDETDSSDSPPRTPEDEENKLIGKKQRAKRSSFAKARNRAYSASPTSKKCAEHRRLSGASSTTRLKKSMSCWSLGELELREVKGFMDLGFTFKKEHLSPRMMSLIPGLQRLEVYKNKENVSKHRKGDQFEEEEDERCVTRPYLSEAWLINRPSSPLLNLRVPRVSKAADMKKHLRFWARIVASEVLQ